MRKGIVSVAAALVAAGVVSASSARAATVYALTDNNFLLKFDSSAPTVLTGVGPILDSANNAVQDLIGIDFRPSTGQMYAVGAGLKLYTINTSTAVATQVATLGADPSDTSNPFTSLGGSRFLFDFDPAADLAGSPSLRIISNTNQNLRVSVATGLTTTDTTLASGNIIAGAYTNNDVNPLTGSVLYGADSVTDQLVLFSNPNAGTYANVGPLGFDASSLAGFDIFFDGVTNTGYAALQDANNGVSKFYTINLATGTATLVNTIEGGDFIDGLAVEPDPSLVPEPAALSLIGLAGLAAVSRRRRG